MFEGYCFNKEGFHTKPVSLNTPEEAIRYCKIQMAAQYEVRIVDEDDCIVMQAIEGKLVFPSKEDCQKIEKN